MGRFIPNFSTTLTTNIKGIWYVQRYRNTGAITVPANAGLAVFESASAVATHDDGTMDEISGLYAMTKSGNENYFVAVDDSVGSTMFVVDRNFDKVCTIALDGVSWVDAEEMSGYKDPSDGKSYILLMEFGDNSANKTTKTIYRFEEPTITGSNLTVTTFDTIDFVYPASPTWEGGSNLGDAEASFACPADGKIYIMSKRETRNFIFSLPIQDTYTGTQTLSYHGLMHADVAEETGGVISPANAVAACISNGLDNVLVKTYNKVYQFYRTARNVTWSQVMTQSAPTVETNYVGRGSPPSQEPQGESICFEHNDEGYFTISEFNGNGSVPFFYYPLSGYSVPDSLSLSFRYGVDGYTESQDTYIDGGFPTTNFSTAPTMISDMQNGADLHRYTIEWWKNLGDYFGPLSGSVVVESASIDYYVAVEGQGFTLHAITSAFDLDISTITYDTLDGVLSGDATPCYDTTAIGTWPGVDTYVGTINVPISASYIQDWIRGTNPSIPCAIIGLGLHPTDGQQLSSTEAPLEEGRPRLNIVYSFE